MRGYAPHFQSKSKTTMQPEGSLSEVEAIRRKIIRQVISTSLNDLFI